MPAAGDAAPDFELPDQDGRPVRLSDLRGQTIVLYFYPRADTPGCTTQACGVRDRTAEYDAAGARVIGVSPDPVKAIRKFADKYGLGFTLLADEDHAVAEAYGTWAEKRRYGKAYWGVQRATFLVDADSRIARVFPKVSPKTHDDETLVALRELADRAAAGSGERDVEQEHGVQATPGQDRGEVEAPLEP
jgi:thioredoxin-dependent peroxiredoxin